MLDQSIQEINGITTLSPAFNDILKYLKKLLQKSQDGLLFEIPFKLSIVISSIHELRNFIATLEKSKYTKLNFKFNLIFDFKNLGTEQLSYDIFGRPLADGYCYSRTNQFKKLVNKFSGLAFAIIKENIHCLDNLEKVYYSWLSLPAIFFLVHELKLDVSANCFCERCIENAIQNGINIPLVQSKIIDLRRNISTDLKLRSEDEISDDELYVTSLDNLSEDEITVDSDIFVWDEKDDAVDVGLEDETKDLQNPYKYLDKETSPYENPLVSLLLERLKVDLVDLLNDNDIQQWISFRTHEITKHNIELYRSFVQAANKTGFDIITDNIGISFAYLSNPYIVLPTQLRPNMLGIDLSILIKEIAPKHIILEYPMIKDGDIIKNLKNINMTIGISSLDVIRYSKNWLEEFVIESMILAEDYRAGLLIPAYNIQNFEIAMDILSRLLRR
ncbi:MAG: hypothetical protein ACP6IU_03115 [Candidatus Asgardarchaeia archaeon]